MMAGCGSNCKNLNVNLAVKKALLFRALVSLLVERQVVLAHSDGVVCFLHRCAINGYDTYKDYKACMAGCASKSN